MSRDKNYTLYFVGVGFTNIDLARKLGAEIAKQGYGIDILKLPVKHLQELKVD